MPIFALLEIQGEAQGGGEVGVGCEGWGGDG